MDLFDLFLFLRLFSNVNFKFIYDKNDLQLFVLYQGEKIPLAVLTT